MFTICQAVHEVPSKLIESFADMKWLIIYLGNLGSYLSADTYITNISVVFILYVSIPLPNAFLLLITEDIFLDSVDTILANFVKIK